MFMNQHNRQSLNCSEVNELNKIKEQLYEYDPAAALTDPESIAIFMADALETGDAEYIAKALAVVERAKAWQT